MRTVRDSRQFKKDVKTAEKRRKDLAKLKVVLSMLISGSDLPSALRDHVLTGYPGLRELHIEPDWLLVYEIHGNVLHLRRTGSHSDLFG